MVFIASGVIDLTSKYLWAQSGFLSHALCKHLYSSLRLAISSFDASAMNPAWVLN